jgi:death-on-curing protein
VTIYLSVRQVLALHEHLVDAFGGARALRERGLLEAAVARPAMTFGGEDLYPDLAAKAAALMHSLVLNHPFIDGNKRAGTSAAELFVEVNDTLLRATDEEFEDITIAVAEGKVSAEALAIWFRQRLKSADPWAEPQ